MPGPSDAKMSQVFYVESSKLRKALCQLGFLSVGSEDKSVLWGIKTHVEPYSVITATPMTKLAHVHLSVRNLLLVHAYQ